MAFIRTIYFFIVLVLSTVYIGTSAVIAYRLTKRNEKPHLLARLWGRVNLWAAGVKVHIRGLENLEPGQPYIFAANHQSWFDIFALLAYLPVQFRWLAKEELFSVPFLGPSMRATGYIPIDRTDRRKAFMSMNLAAAKVKSGTSIVIFPEGTRSPNGGLQEFRKGGFILAIKSQQPIVPVSISGSFRIISKTGSWMIRRHEVFITVGKPIQSAGLTAAEREALISQVREAILTHLTSEERALSKTADSEPSTSEPLTPSV